MDLYLLANRGRLERSVPLDSERGPQSSVRTRPGPDRCRRAREGQRPVGELECQGIPPLRPPPLSDPPAFEDDMLDPALAQSPAHGKTCLTGTDNDDVEPFDHVGPTSRRADHSAGG